MAANNAVVSHLLRYGISSLGSYHPSDDDFAAAISSGFDESVGSRIIDDLDLVQYSGNPELFIVGVDYVEYDSHCTWKNFREPMISTLKDIFKDEKTTFAGRTRSELVDKAYGPARLHGTLWDVKRRVVRARKDKIDDLMKPADGAAASRAPPLKAAPPGVRGICSDVKDVEDSSGDILICSTEGHNFNVLNSHGSGELTTLLFNSVHNLAIGDVIFSNDRLRRVLSVEYRRVVENDRYSESDGWRANLH